MQIGNYKTVSEVIGLCAELHGNKHEGLKEFYFFRELEVSLNYKNGAKVGRSYCDWV